MGFRQNVEQEKSEQEVRQAQPASNTADAPSKPTKASNTLLQLVQEGQYDLLGGTTIENSAGLLAKTWLESTQTEQQERKRRAGRDKSDRKALLFQFKLSVQEATHQGRC